MTDSAEQSFLKRMMENQVVRFILSAGAGFVVDISCYYLLYNRIFTQKAYNLFGFPVSRYVLSLAVSFFLGVLVNFLVTKFLVFTESKLSPGKQFFRFVSVAILGFFANLGILAFMVQKLNIDPPIARPAAALSLFFASFFVHKLFSFNLSMRHHGTRKYSN
jgi:putative flippase GtrA